MANMGSAQGYLPSTDGTGRTSYADQILTTMANNSLNIWGFVLVRCSYADEAKWEAFLANIKEKTLEHDSQASTSSNTQLNERLRWTVIEDPEKLEGASMQIASARFNEWVQTAGREEQTFPSSIGFPRYRLFLYIDAAALEFVTKDSGTRFHQAGPGYQPALVWAWLNLVPPYPDDEPLAPDESFFRIATCHLDFYFAVLLKEDAQVWYLAWEDSQSKILGPEETARLADLWW